MPFFVWDMDAPRNAISAASIYKAENHNGNLILKSIVVQDNMPLTSNWENGDKVLAIGSHKSITYSYQTAPEMMKNYFTIIEEENSQVLELIDKVMIQSQQFFPIYAFAQIDPSIKRIEKLKKQQKNKLEALMRQIEQRFDVNETALEDILFNESYAMTYKNQVIAYALLKRNIEPKSIEDYLKKLSVEIGNTTDYRRLLCAYDYVKYFCD